VLDALAPEFEIAAELLRARLRAGLTPALCRGDPLQVPRAAIGGLIRRLRGDRPPCRAKSQIGAPRSMKMGTIRSPWRYDCATGSTSPRADARHGARSCYARGTSRWIAEVCADPARSGAADPKSVLSMAGRWNTVRTGDGAMDDA
jgi:hypothetical protein